MASENKKKKAQNSYTSRNNALKNSVQKMKLKRILFYTNIDRRINKQCNKHE